MPCYLNLSASRLLAKFYSEGNSVSELFDNIFAERVLIEEVTYNCMMADGQFDSFLSYLKQSEERQNRLVWAHLQSFLMHSGMVSKFAKPLSKVKFAKQRGEEVQRLFDIAADSPIFCRSARNNLEHFDERLDSWLQTESKAILECVFETQADFDYLKRDKFIRRVLILDSLTYFSHGKNGELGKMELLSLHKEILRIRDIGTNLLEVA